MICLLFMLSFLSRCEIYFCERTEVNWFRRVAQMQFVSNNRKSLSGVKVCSVIPWFPLSVKFSRGNEFVLHCWEQIGAIRETIVRLMNWVWQSVCIFLSASAHFCLLLLCHFVCSSASFILQHLHSLSYRPIFYSHYMQLEVGFKRSVSMWKWFVCMHTLNFHIDNNAVFSCES